MRAAGGVPEGASAIQAGAPPWPLALVSTQVSPNTAGVPAASSPPNTIIRFVAASYTALAFVRGAGGVPVGESASHWLPLPVVACVSTQTSLRGPAFARPPKTIMRSPVESSTAAWPSRASGGVPAGKSLVHVWSIASSTTSVSL